MLVDKAFPDLSAAEHQENALKLGSDFIREKINELCSSFIIEYQVDHNRIEYFLTDKASNDEVSFSLIFCRNIFSHQLHVSKFYPGLFRRPNCKYLSAASFFLMVHHCADLFAMAKGYSIFLQCRRPIYDDFYSKLGDFDLNVVHDGQGENVDVTGPLQYLKIDTTMIILRRNQAE